MTIKTILFDLDGTLLDTNELIIQSFQHTYQKHLNKKVPRETIIKSFGEILQHTMEREFNECAQEALQTYRNFQNSHFYDYITMHAGVKEALQFFYEKEYKLGVVTSRLNDSALKGLKHFHLEHYFGSIIGADDTNKHKPDPTPALMALEELEQNPEETMMVGDSPYDVLCGKNAGMKTVAVGWSALPREMYMTHNPDYLVESMEELVALVEKLNTK
ncbi:pyrophosphatase PpaX [Clostridiaceae bacterium 35-E11]